MDDNKLRELAGEQPADDQVAYRREGEVDDLGQLTTSDIYAGELEAGVHDDLPTEDPADNIEQLTATELRAGETENPNVAAEEGMTYVPPTDPPVIEPSEEDSMAARVREELRADATTSRYADSVAIGTRGRTVALRGVVDDIDDTDALVEVAGRAPGVAEVIDELEVRGL
jgi:osmotically-inducible protein OsmY